MRPKPPPRPLNATAQPKAADALTLEEVGLELAYLDWNVVRLHELVRALEALPAPIEAARAELNAKRDALRAAADDVLAAVALREADHALASHLTAVRAAGGEDGAISRGMRTLGEQSAIDGWADTFRHAVSVATEAINLKRTELGRLAEGVEGARVKIERKIERTLARQVLVRRRRAELAEQVQAGLADPATSRVDDARLDDGDAADRAAREEREAARVAARAKAAEAEEAARVAREQQDRDEVAARHGEDFANRLYGLGRSL